MDDYLLSSSFATNDPLDELRHPAPVGGLMLSICAAAAQAIFEVRRRRKRKREQHHQQQQPPAAAAAPQQQPEAEAPVHGSVADSSTASEVTWENLPGYVQNVSPAELDRNWRQLYRLSFSTFNEVAGELRPTVAAVLQQHGEPNWPQEKAIAAVLHKLASGLPTATVAAAYAMQEHLLDLLFSAVVRVLAEEVYKKWIIAPSGSRLRRMVAEFREETGLDNMCGAIGGTHIPISHKLGKEVSKRQFKSGHRFYSILFQGICDRNKLFWFVSSELPGSYSNVEHLQSSVIWQKLVSREVLPDPMIRVCGVEVRPFLAGDNRFPPLPFLLTPFVSEGALRDARQDVHGASSSLLLQGHHQALPSAAADRMEHVGDSQNVDGGGRSGEARGRGGLLQQDQSFVMMLRSDSGRQQGDPLYDSLPLFHFPSELARDSDISSILRHFERSASSSGRAAGLPASSRSFKKHGTGPASANFAPVQSTLETNEAKFNRAVGRGRCRISQAFGLLKARWRILRTCNLTVHEAPQVAVACAVLHNICELSGEPFEDSLDPHPNDFHPIQDEANAVDDPLGRQGVELRRILFRDFVARMHGS